MNAIPLPVDLFWLCLSAMSVGLMWLPHMTRLVLQTGWRVALWNPQHELQPDVRWAQRAKRAQRNAVRHFAVLAVIVLIAHLQGVDPAWTAVFVRIWLVTRLAQFAAYTAGVPTVPQIMFLLNISTSILLGWTLIAPNLFE